jgi:hypothetical protein
MAPASVFPRYPSNSPPSIDCGAEYNNFAEMTYCTVTGQVLGKKVTKPER